MSKKSQNLNFLIHHLKDILLSLIEISEILIEKIFEMKSLNKTGLSMNLKIQIWYGLTGKQNFLRVVNFTLQFVPGHCLVIT